MPAFSRELELTLHRALALANERSHEYSTIEHLLLSLIDDVDAMAVLVACEVETSTLRERVSDYIDNELGDMVEENVTSEAKPTASFQRTIQRAHIHVQSSGREEVSGANVLIAIFAERESHAAFFLQEQDMTRYDAVNFVSHGLSKRDLAERLSKEKETSHESVDRELRVVKAVVPTQLPAPIQVNEREGKIFRVSTAETSVAVEIGEIERWRKLVIAHISELLTQDFQLGTNHDRVRRRLVCIRDLLEHDAKKLIEDQFYLGYEIERFECIVKLYSNRSDDLPALLEHVLKDVEMLSISLCIGLSKFDRWHAFKASDNKLISTSNSDLDNISQALTGIATKMKQRGEVFDDPLARHFDFLAESLENKAEVSDLIVAGGVKSVQNLVSFLAHKALDFGKGLAKAVSNEISKLAAISFIALFAPEALKISAALSSGWTWLQTLLDFLQKYHF